MNKPKRFTLRRWLNKPGWFSGGYIVLNITPEVYKGDKSRNADVTFNIADCSRVVSLDFDLYGNDAGRKNALYKARLLQQSINSFVEKLEEAIAWIEEKSDAS